MYEPIETFEHAGRVVKLYYDHDSPDPRRDMENLGTMVCGHGRYELGDEQVEATIDPQGRMSSWASVERYLRLYRGAEVVLPLYLYDHSGLSIRTSPFPGPWDTGLLGLIYLTREQVRTEYGHLSPKTRLEAARNGLIAEVETYNDFLTGQVYAYTVEDHEGNVLDSCGDIYGMDNVTEVAQEAADENAAPTGAQLAGLMLGMGDS